MTTSKSLARLLSDLEKKYQNPEKAVENFLRYIKEKNLAYKLPKVLEHLERKASTTKEAVLDLHIAHEVSAEVENEIRKSVGVDQNVTMVKKIDKKLLGGFVAEYKNVLYDGSVQGQLKRLKEVLLEN